MKSIVYLTIVIAFSLAMMNCSSSKSAGNSSAEPLTLLPSVKEQTSDFVTFAVKAVRNRIVDGEYLPSSEDIRIYISDSNGKQVWNSDYNMNFTMAIGDVRPKKVGDTHEYTAVWNKKDNDGKRMQPGVYNARMVIPAQPNNYSVNFAFSMD
ncbi:MAG: BsuPI-related putative proteinase inhibitor [Candidatus Kapabacteria bacterium]|nr:BsuPI-related putative proteinase inhibitor [Candidatus Kapabacteria bacterium]